MILDLIRHGDTGRRGYLDGRHDPPLLAGACQDWQAWFPLHEWSHVISSPLLRARQTAQALLADGAPPPELSHDWAEWDFGDWDGQSQAALSASEENSKALAAFQRDPIRFPPPHAEPWDAFQARIERALRALASGDDEASALVVTHAGPIRQAIALACGLPMMSLWAVRIEYGTRVRLRVGIDVSDRLWGELIEVRQACA